MKFELQGTLKRSISGVLCRRGLCLALLTAVFAGVSLGSAAPASADGLELCAGYAACSTGGFTTHNYQQFASDSWWRMFPGDNCTNYAAFVEATVYGVATPDYLLGNGGQWAANAAAQGVPVDTIPTVGSVAVWDEGAGNVQRRARCRRRGRRAQRLLH